MNLLHRLAAFWTRWSRRRKALFHEGERTAQTRFGTRYQAERLDPRYIHPAIPTDYQAFIEKQTFFFIATADHLGRCDCSHRGMDEEARRQGYPAVTIPDERTLLFPDFPGNGLYPSIGNLYMNPHIGMIFIDFSKQQRVRVNGRVEILEDLVEAKRFFGEKAQRIIRVNVEEVFANCPRYIQKNAHSSS